jgi:glyoxylate/hydroxypyruvate reductase A
MVEWVTGHVLRHHLGMDRHIINPDHEWTPVSAPLAAERCVAILGLGELGRAVAQSLARIGFDVTGWSRHEKTVAGITTHHGEQGLAQTLARAQIVVLLLPDTPATVNLMDATRLAQMPKGAVIVNPGRGVLIDDSALLAALDAGHLDHATLDVFRTEPLPQDHPFWAHPKVTVTPHIAAETRAPSAARMVVENIARGEAGLPFLHLVDRRRGY